ncbi:MAG: hypothetical protein ABSB79_11260 [Syntrophales bacterium]|jgi:hypothetical protein
MPDYEKWLQDQRYHNKDMSVITDWGWNKNHQELSSTAKEIIVDSKVNEILKRIPVGAREQILRSTLLQLSVADLHGAHLLGNRTYLRLCDRVRTLLGVPQPIETDDISKLDKGLRTVFQIASLRFSLGSVREFMSLRKNATLRQYGLSFREKLLASPDDKSAKLKLFRSMADAINTSEIATQINGGLNISATITGVASLIPFMGTATGLVGLGVDASGKAAVKVKEKNSWWLLAPEISKTLTRSRIEQTLRALEKGEIDPTNLFT